MAVRKRHDVAVAVQRLDIKRIRCATSHRRPDVCACIWVEIGWASSKEDLPGVGKVIRGFAGITDEIVLRKASLRRFWRQGSQVFDNALHTAIYVARTEDDAR